MLTTHTCPNGLVLIVEEIPHVESAAYELLIPGGVINDDEGHVGTTLVLAELLSRGAGPYDSRALSDAFDAEGIAHSESGGYDRFSFRGSLLADGLDKALELVGLIVREPRLPEDEIESIQSLLLHDLASLVDNPAKRVMIALAEKYYPGVWSRPAVGTEEGIKAVTSQYLRSQCQSRIRPNGSVLSIAGRVKTAQVIKAVESHFADWKGEAQKIPPVGVMPPLRAHHIHFDSAQAQIALAYPSAPFGTKHFYAAKVATGVLSGGMFGRLFIEVREKRGLCYSVYARHAGTQHFGTVTAYAGTTPERADETLQVMLAELRKLHGTVTDEELGRSKANLKASLIIGEESTGARAASSASDWWLGRRIRSVDEILGAISAVQKKEIDEYLEAFPVREFMTMTLGPRPLVGGNGHAIM